jgi:hypothetical protein
MNQFERTHYSVTHDLDDEGSMQMRFKVRRINVLGF